MNDMFYAIKNNKNWIKKKTKQYSLAPDVYVVQFRFPIQIFEQYIHSCANCMNASEKNQSQTKTQVHLMATGYWIVR